MGLTLGVGTAVSLGVLSKAPTKAVETKAYSDVEIRFTNNWNWSDVYIYAWVEDGSGTPAVKNAAWPGVKLDESSYQNEDNQSVYIISLSGTYDRIIFNNGNGGEGNQTGNITYDGGSRGYYAVNNSFGTYELTSRYFLYDYANAFNGAYCHYWNEYTTVEGATTFPGVAMQSYNFAGGAGYLYYIDLDVKYNSVIFTNEAGTPQTVDLKPSTSKNPRNWKCYYHGNGVNAWWDMDAYILAHNFAYNVVKLRTIDASDPETEVSTADCDTNYNAAKGAYEQVAGDATWGTSFKEKLALNDFSAAVTRLEKWANAHGQTFTVNGGFVKN